MGTLTYTNTLTAGTPENVNQLNQNLADIQSVVNGGIDATNLASNAVTTAKITNANVTDAKLASPNNSVYKTIMRGTAIISGGSGAGATVNLAPAGNGGYIASGTTSSSHAGFYLAAADYAVAGLTTKLRVRHTVTSNATAAGTTTITVGLYPVTTAGGAGTIAHTAGTLVASSGAAIVTPAASAVTTAVSSDVTFPTDGFYNFGAVISVGNTAANNVLLSHFALEIRHT